MEKIQLRKYQIEAIKKLRLSFQKGNKKILLVAPTGSGKPVIASAMIEKAMQKNNQVLFVAHRRELIKQCSKKLKDFVGFQSPDLIKYLDSLDFETANNFAQALNTRRARDLGTPNINRILQQTINPLEAGTNPMDSLILLELQKGANPVKITDIGGFPHLSYDYAVLGRPVAKFEVPVPAETIFPDFFTARRMAGSPKGSDPRAFTMSNVVQEITPEIAKGMATKRVGSM